MDKKRKKYWFDEKTILMLSFLKEIIEFMKEVTEKELEINFEKEQKGDVRYTNADISKSKKILGWLPKFSNAESIISSYDSYIINKDKKYISNKNSPHTSALSKGLLKYAYLFY